MTLRTRGRRLLERCGWTVRRVADANRFDAARVSLEGLARRGFRPGLIVDAGAHAGDWTALARDVFPEAHIHAVEPAPAAMARLEAATAGWRRLTLHRVAVTAPGRADVRLVDGGSTGAWVSDDPSVAAASVPATTLDALVAGQCRPGVSVLLGATDVVFCEVSFYDVASQGHMLVGPITARLAEHGFQLYDVAALAGRARDGRLRSGDVIYVRAGGPLDRDRAWA
jgi:FkbM family methyltransferase